VPLIPFGDGEVPAGECQDVDYGAAINGTLADGEPGSFQDDDNPRTFTLDLEGLEPGRYSFEANVYYDEDACDLAGVWLSNSFLVTE
jgi:hypothetical protein